MFKMKKMKVFEKKYSKPLANIFPMRYNNKEMQFGNDKNEFFKLKYAKIFIDRIFKEN